MQLRWGIVSAGIISNDFVSSLRVLPKNEQQVIAIAARSYASAKTFADFHAIPKAYEGYQKLAQDQEIDIVYIGNLNPQHYEVSKLMLESGKHVLCEKPLTMNAKQTESLIKIALQRKKLLLDGIWSRSFPVYLKLKELLDKEIIGKVLHVNVAFGHNLTKIERLRSKSMGGGTILDLGIYTLQLQQLVYKNRIPTKVLASAHLNSEGVDESFSAILDYEDGATALIHASANALYPNEAMIVGSKGSIKIPYFWCPTKLITPNETFEFDIPKNDGKFNLFNSAGLVYQAIHAKECIENGILSSPNISHAESLQLAKLMDQIRKQVGVEFPEDFD